MYYSTPHHCGLRFTAVQFERLRGAFNLMIRVATNCMLNCAIFFSLILKKMRKVAPPCKSHLKILIHVLQKVLTM